MRTAEERARLPKWAQAELNHLERDVAAWKAKVAALGESAPTDTQAQVGGYQSTNLMLPNGTEIHFVFGEDSDEHIDVRVEDGELYVSAGSTLQVTPWSSNVVKLKVVRR